MQKVELENALITVDEMLRLRKEKMRITDCLAISCIVKALAERATKVWCVMDGFHGTDSDCNHDTLSSIWLEEDKARAVAESAYLRGVEQYDVYGLNVPVPQYAQTVYEKLLKKRKTTNATDAAENTQVVETMT